MDEIIDHLTSLIQHVRFNFVYPSNNPDYLSSKVQMPKFNPEITFVSETVGKMSRS